VDTYSEFPTIFSSNNYQECIKRRGEEGKEEKELEEWRKMKKKKTKDEKK
jgi:hypothetical protein